MDFYDMFFADSRRDQKERRNKDIVQQTSVTLEEVYKGSIRKLILHRYVMCGKCESPGGKKAAVAHCPTCRGVGQQPRVQKLNHSMVQQTQSVCVCAHCCGLGTYINPVDRCQYCNGKKMIRERKLFQVNIDKEIPRGDQIILNGEGHQEPDSPAGDIIIEIDLIDHPIFKRCGQDLKIVQEIHLVDSLCGFDKVIRTLDDRELLINVKRGEITKHGDVKCILNEGMPHYENPYEKGRLIIKFVVIFPTEITPAVIPILEHCFPTRPEVVITEEVKECILIPFDEKNDQKNAAQKHARQKCVIM